MRAERALEHERAMVEEDARRKWMVMGAWMCDAGESTAAIRNAVERALPPTLCMPMQRRPTAKVPRPVSYTHLTLPTICSV
eukprot:3395195-Rhodomonas_salina.1